MTLGLRHMAKTTGRLRKEGPLGPWCSSPPRPEPAAGQGWHFHLGPPGEPGDSQTRFWNLQPTRENSEETPDSAEAQILPPRRNHHQPPHAGAPFSHLPPQETGVDFPAPKPGLYVPVGSARGPQSSKTLPSYHPQGPGSATARRPGPNGAMPLIWVIDKTLAPSTIHLITGYSTSDNSVEIDSAWYSVSEIVDLFTFLDKMPCGISLGNPNRAPVQKKINVFRKSNFGGKR